MVEMIITEKPNAAKKIAHALADGKPIAEKNNGVIYYNITHGNTDILVGCAVGHLYTVAEKNKSGWKYPVFDTEWVPSSTVNKASTYTTKYLSTLKKLAKKCDSFTVATDFDIEGEVIGLNILKHACKQKDGNRMKFSTLTTPDLIKAYENKQKHLEWGQANAGVTRHELDWIYGINLSRALTLSVKAATKRFKLLSSGRVQGPALKLLVDKEKEIQAFVPDPFWQIKLFAKAKSAIIEANHEKDKFFEKKDADKAYDNVKDQKTCKIEDVSKKKFTQAPPVPFDLTSLQIEAHKTLKIAPKETLELAQELYIEGAISYPRTSSQKLPKEIGYKNILKSLQKQKEYTLECEIVLKKKDLRPNEGKKSDEAHPAIYPTGINPQIAKGSRQEKLYDLIVRRFLAVFGDPATRETVSIKFDVNSEIFVAKGTRTVEKGWHTLYGRYVMLDEQELPALKQGQEVEVKEITFEEKETSPPKRYTASSIIKELEKRNLGTKATRAQIVENLYQRGYVNERSIEATGLGIKICDILDKYCPMILDQKLTAEFEEDMEEIRQKNKSPEEVLEHAKSILLKICQEFKKKEKEIGLELSKANDETRDELTYVGKCPSCSEGNLHIRRGRFGPFIACNRYPDCKTIFNVPKNGVSKPAKKECEECGYPMITLIRRGKKPMNVCINPKCPSKLSENKEVREEMKNIEEGKIEKACPKCGSPLKVRKSIYGAFLGCSNYPKCKYVENVDDENKKESSENKNDE